jgi:hypothetical protein
MATDELMELFNLDSTQTSSTSNLDGPTKKRKRKLPIEVADAEKEFSVEELWDSSQYDDQHSIQSFIEKAER